MTMKTNANDKMSWLLYGMGVCLGMLLMPQALAGDFTLTAAPTVPDPVLAKMCGRGELGGQIVFFGIQMQTQWQQGATTQSSSLNVALNSSGNTFVPTITFVQNNAQLSRQLAPKDVQMQAAGLNNVHGVTQGIQIGGDYNTVGNNVTMNVVRGQPGILAADSGDILAMGTHTVGNTTLTINPDTLSMMINNGASQVTQQIGANGLAQLVQLAANNSNIHNNMTLTVGESAANLSQQINLAGLQGMLNNMRALTVP